MVDLITLITMAKEDDIEEEEKPRKRGQMRLIWCKQRALAESTLSLFVLSSYYYMCPHTQRALEESVLPTYLRRSKSALRN
jgi:hypothetical protein